jgi:hypothetical protein
MKKPNIILFIIIWLLTAILFTALGAGGYWMLTMGKTEIETEVIIQGTITDIDNGCWANGNCSIKVNNNWIIAEEGGLHPLTSNIALEPRGNQIDIIFSEDTKKYIGKKVEIYGREINEYQFTIYGSEAYYIKLINY